MRAVGGLIFDSILFMNSIIIGRDQSIALDAPITIFLILFFYEIIFR